MNVRIIAGQYGGRIIGGSNSELTHPMGERIRNAMFNKIGTELEGAEVLDAFAGSGALGLEALSRGATRVTFVERNQAAQKVIEQNITILGVTSASKLIKAAVATWQKKTAMHFDIIFADPPYDDLQLSTVSDLFTMLKPNGLMVLSYPGRSEAPTATGVVVVDNRSYGTAALTFYRREP